MVLLLVLLRLQIIAANVIACARIVDPRETAKQYNYYKDRKDDKTLQNSSLELRVIKLPMEEPTRAGQKAMSGLTDLTEALDSILLKNHHLYSPPFC